MVYSFSTFILHCRVQLLLTEDSDTSTYDDEDDGNSPHTGEPLSAQSQQTMSQCDPHQQSSFYNLLKCKVVSTAVAAFSIDLYIIFIMWRRVSNIITVLCNSLVIMKDCRKITAQGALMYVTSSQSENQLELELYKITDSLGSCCLKTSEMARGKSSIRIWLPSIPTFFSSCPCIHNMISYCWMCSWDVILVRD